MARRRQRRSRIRATSGGRGGRAGAGPRFEAEGTRLGGLLLGTAILLGAGAAALALAAILVGPQGLGLDLAARLAFLLILIFGVTPRIGRARPRRLDPLALPDGLLD